jgi:putative tricarboxylic transport membrane protein
MTSRLKSVLPYAMLLGVAAGLFWLTGSISYTARPGQLGPDFWPKVAIGLIAAVSIYEVLRRLFTASAAETRGIADELGRDEAAGTEYSAARGSVILLLAGVILTLAYAILLGRLGFILASFGFLVLFMYLGGIRNHIVVWAGSALGVLLFAFVFLKVVYVSLPRGAPPFDQVTQGVMDILRVK